MTRLSLIVFTYALFVSIALASEAPHEFLSINGHLKIQENATQFSSSDARTLAGGKHTFEHQIDWRVNARAESQDFRFDAAVEFLAIGGNNLDLQRGVTNSSIVPGANTLLGGDERRLVDLTATLGTAEDFESVIRADRLHLSYTTERLVLKVGRQSVSWGNGLVFSALDLFNPFSPTEIDKDYKSGDDMVYLQWLAKNGADVQILAVGRRNPLNDTIALDRASLGGKVHFTLPETSFEFDLLGGRHFGENVFGAGIARELFSGVVRSDLLFSELESGELEVSALINYDRSWFVFEHNLYGYIEYFHSGLGARTRDLSRLSSELRERISRGELFTIGKDYLAVGGYIELAPLLNLFSNSLISLRDESGIIQKRLEWDASQNFRIAFGLNLPFGPTESEFGGLILPGLQASTLGSGTTGYVRMSFFLDFL